MTLEEPDGGAVRRASIESSAGEPCTRASEFVAEIPIDLSGHAPGGRRAAGLTPAYVWDEGAVRALVLEAGPLAV